MGGWGGYATAPGEENGYVDVPYGATLTCTASPAPWLPIYWVVQ